MKRFITKCILFTIVILSFVFFVFSRADGHSDPFYIRFTTPKYSSLILGTSRSAQGIQPRELKKILSKNIFNYSFTIMHSPYGPTYYKSIKRKIDQDAKDGIFIVTVDPWSISSFDETSDEISLFRENKLFLENMTVVNTNPNITYLIKWFNGRYYKILWNNPFLKYSVFLHNDGWLEVDADINKEDFQDKIDEEIERFIEKTLPSRHVSNVRIDYLIKIIEFLKAYGEVYLVRLPIHPKMMEVENYYMPNFEMKIKKAINTSGNYLDLTPYNFKYIYTDSNHLYKQSGKEVSRVIAEWILKQKNMD